MKTINATGRPCPEPVTMTKAVVDQGETELEVLLDNPVSASNVTRFLESRGYGVRLRDDEGLLTVSAQKKDTIQKAATPQKQTTILPPASSKTIPAAASVPAHGTATPSGAFSVLLTSKTLGRSDEELGEILIKGFLGTLSQLDRPPLVVALMNEGVKLALYDSSSCDHLKNLENKGALVLVCGTCVNHFGIGEQIGVGKISNMFEILETLNQADKIITL